MAKEPIIGSGFRGAAFEQKGMSERNLQVLLKSLSNKTTQRSIEALSKIEKDEWVAMAASATMLNSFVALGGVTTLTSSIQNTIKLQIDSLLSPLQNTIDQAIIDLVNPFLELLNPIISDLTTFLSENDIGAGIGGIAGSLLQWLPGGSLWVLLGSSIGALIQTQLEIALGGPLELMDDPMSEADRMTLLQWLALGGTLEEYMLFGGPGGGGSAGAPSLPGRLGRIEEF